MTEEKKTKVEFAPGCFDHFDGTQEELDRLMGDIVQMFEGMSPEEVLAQGTPLTEETFNELPEEIKQQLAKAFDDTEAPKRTLQ